MGGGFGFDWRFGWSFCLGGDVGWFIVVVALVLPSA
jgi:hypothetical protein